MVEVHIFAPFYALLGEEEAVEAMLRERAVVVRAEPGCLGANAFRSARDQRSFWTYSHWIDKEAAESHTTTPHMVQFVEKMQELTVGPLDVTSTHLIA